MYKSMRRLIEKHFYKTAEEAQEKLDVFFACNRLTVDEYTILNDLIHTVYDI